MQDSTLFEVDYFPPSKGRTIFFSEWCTMYGVSDQDDLEGIASLMGNTSRTLLNHYAPQRKRRLTQRMVNERAAIACQQFKSAMLRVPIPDGAHQHESGPSGVNKASDEMDLDDQCVGSEESD
jgi:hypothetical protein